MSIIRGVKDRRFKFVQLLNSMFEDPNLSLKAKGFIGYCLTKPSTWRFSVEHLSDVLKEGKNAIYSVINECIEQGYAIRYQPRSESGGFQPLEVVVSDSKHEIQEMKEELKKCLPNCGFRDAGFTVAENRDYSNTDSVSNTELTDMIDPGGAGQAKQEQTTQDPLLVFSTFKGSSVSIRQSEAIKYLEQQNYSELQISSAIATMRKKAPKLQEAASIIKYLEQIIKNEIKEQMQHDKRRKRSESKLDPVRVSAETFKQSSISGPGYS